MTNKELIHRLEDRDKEIELLNKRIRQLELQRDFLVRKLIRLEKKTGVIS